MDAEDFYQYVARKEETMWSTFQDLDLDGTGEVDEEELLQALRWGVAAAAPFCCRGCSISRLLTWSKGGGEERMTALWPTWFAAPDACIATPSVWPAGDPCARAA